MTGPLHLSPIPDDSGFDGVTFSATLEGTRTIGQISRSQLLKWAKSPSEPEVGIFMRCIDLIEPVVLAKLEKQPNMPISLSAYDF